MFEILKGDAIRLQIYRVSLIRVCGKDSDSLDYQTMVT